MNRYKVYYENKVMGSIVILADHCTVHESGRVVSFYTFKDGLILIIPIHAIRTIERLV